MKNTTSFKKNTPLDLICLGRAGVDFYANQIGAKLEDANGFSKYIGGSSANIAFGTARLGLKSSMLTRVGDEHMGRFIRESLVAEGCDVSRIKTDPDRLTALVILGIKDKDTFPLIFYRENCADMAISTDDFDEEYIASAKVLLITGTHFSTESTKKTAVRALETASRNETRTVLDIDFRPVLWGLTGKGDGESRFITSENVTSHLRSILPYFDLIVGTEEEFFIAGGSENIMECLKTLRKISGAVFVVKRGPYGCTVFGEHIPENIDDGFSVKGVQVEVLNVLGAGDAFMSGFLKGWINKEDYESCCSYANACGALVVSRHACSPSMPTLTEFNYYLKNIHGIKHPDKDERLALLHRKTVPKKQWGELCIFAFDHRKQITELFETAGIPSEEIPKIKNLMVNGFLKTVKEFEDGFSPGVLIDDIYGQDALNKITGMNCWIARPVEQPLSRPVKFEGECDIGSRLGSWPLEHIVKCLVYYHPDDEQNMLLSQQEKIIELFAACRKSGHELLLEIILPDKLPRNDETIISAINQIYSLKVYPDWWKLEKQPPAVWEKIENLINEKDEHCRGILILGLDEPIHTFETQFAGLRKFKLIKGFAIGRTIFKDPLENFLRDGDENKFINQIYQNYKTLITYWKNR